MKNVKKSSLARKISPWIAASLTVVMLETTAFAAVATVNVNLRVQPSTEAQIVSLVSGGKEVDVVDEVDGWTRVTFNGQSGYIKSEYLKSQEEYKKDIKSSVELISWSEAKNVVEIGKVIEVYDILTGKKYNVKSFSNGNHADVETVTQEDTNIMKETFGGVWKWDPRPVWVTVNGRTIAASINGQPHGGGTNNSNGMNGQVCLHFKGSTTHNGNQSFTEWHQKELMRAYELAQ